MKIQESTAERFGFDSVFRFAMMYRDYHHNMKDLRIWGQYYSIPKQDIPGMIKLCKACHEAGF